MHLKKLKWCGRLGAGGGVLFGKERQKFTKCRKGRGRPSPGFYTGLCDLVLLINHMFNFPWKHSLRSVVLYLEGTLSENLEQTYR